VIVMDGALCVQGASGVGYGNFQEVGPLTVDLKPRSSTWLNVAHLLFVVILGLSLQSLSATCIPRCLQLRLLCCVLVHLTNTVEACCACLSILVELILRAHANAWLILLLSRQEHLLGSLWCGDVECAGC
jgi:hypothetical protein